jgi:gliding motility-associated-like protein
MKSSVLPALILLSVGVLWGQGNCPNLGPDQFLPCGTTSTTLTANFSNCPAGTAPLETSSYAISSIPFSADPYAGTQVTLSDDNQTGMLPIGFTFCFYGQTYTQFIIGSNNWIGFLAGQTSTWVTTAIPQANGSAPRGTIMGPWQDINPGVGGQVRYQVLGTAPCRRLVVSYFQVPMFSCGSLFTSQIKIFESTNIIETHIQTKPICASWNSGNAVHGLHNPAGSAATVVAGRNNTQWTTTNEGIRFTPNGNPVAGVITWYQVGNAAPIGTGPSITVSPPPQGANYTARLEYGACYQGYAQCVNQAGGGFPDTVFVVPGPPFITPSINPPFDFCPGTSLTLTTPVAYTTYLWNGSVNTPTFTTTQPGSVTLDVVDNNGCTGSVTVNLTHFPQPVLQIAPVNPSLCPGDSVQIQVSGASTYVWTPAFGLSSTTSPSVWAAPPSTTLYTVTGTDVNGCIATITNTVTIFPAPSIMATALPGGICPGFSTQLLANGASSYVWSPALGLSATNIANPQASPPATQIYSVTGTDGNGCNATNQVTVTVYPLPVADFFAPNLSGCAPVSFTLQDASTVSSGTIVNYQWNIQSVGALTGPAPSFTISNPGSYNVELMVTTSEGCRDTLLRTGYLQVHPIPIAAFSASPNPAELDNAFVTFTNLSSPDAISFFWDMGGFQTTTAANPTIQFPSADTFLVTLIAMTQFGCTDSTAQSIVIRDITEIWIPNSFTPNGDGLNEGWFPRGRGLDGSGNVFIEVNIFNRWGELIYTSNSSAKPWFGTYPDLLEECPTGVYTYAVLFINERNKEFYYHGKVNLIR